MGAVSTWMGDLIRIPTEDFDFYSFFFFFLYVLILFIYPCRRLRVSLKKVFSESHYCVSVLHAFDAFSFLKCVPAYIGDFIISK